MKVSEYKAFKREVQNAIVKNDNNSPIWFAGYLWINLTKKQAADIVKTLMASSEIVKDAKYVYTPSSIGVALEQ